MATNRTPPPPGIPEEDWNAANDWYESMPDDNPIKGDLGKDVNQDPESVAQRATVAQRELLTGKMREGANAFGASIPVLQQSIYAQMEGDAKSRIADQQRRIGRQAKRRGLLYSGMRTGEESRASSQIAGQAAAQKSKVAPELQRMYEDLSNQVANVAQANYADDMGVAKNVFDRALADAKSRSAQLGDLFEVGGNVAGRYFGSSSPESDIYEMEKRREG